VPVRHKQPPIHSPVPLSSPELKSFFYSFSSPFRILESNLPVSFSFNTHHLLHRIL